MPEDDDKGPLICWRKGCPEKHTARFKISLQPKDRASMIFEGKFCEKHFIEAWDKDFQHSANQVVNAFLGRK